jgi:hypothetical protein
MADRVEVDERLQPAGHGTLSPAWLLTGALALGRAAEDEVKARRMTTNEASPAVHRSFPRLFGPSDDARQR